MRNMISHIHVTYIPSAEQTAQNAELGDHRVVNISFLQLFSASFALLRSAILNGSKRVVAQGGDDRRKSLLRDPLICTVFHKRINELFFSQCRFHT